MRILPSTRKKLWKNLLWLLNDLLSDVNVTNLKKLIGKKTLKKYLCWYLDIHWWKEKEMKCRLKGSTLKNKLPWSCLVMGIPYLLTLLPFCSALLKRRDSYFEEKKTRYSVFLFYPSSGAFIQYIYRLAVSRKSFQPSRESSGTSGGYSLDTVFLITQILFRPRTEQISVCLPPVP